MEGVAWLGLVFATHFPDANLALQSLNAELDSKGAALQGLEERCVSKDEELASLGQQLEQLQGKLAAQQQTDMMEHQQSPRDWAVHVSLDQGIGLGPVHLMPSSPSALRQRVQTLEVNLMHAKRTCWRNKNGAQQQVQHQ